MGCDIHPVIEVQEFGWWHVVAVPPSSRNYEFFGWLAGVRGGDLPVVPLRGIPKNSGCEKFLSGEHSASWFTLEEAGVFPFPKDKWAKAYWMRWLRYMRFIKQDYGVGALDVRVVFDFDS